MSGWAPRVQIRVESGQVGPQDKKFVSIRVCLVGSGRTNLNDPTISFLGGSGYNGGNLDYPGVPFGGGDFHQPYCEINNYQNVDEVRNCYLVTLNDLDGGKDYVRGKIADYFNDLINIGVSGFRVDASKHMWPGDLEAIQVSIVDTIIILKGRIENLKTKSFLFLNISNLLSLGQLRKKEANLKHSRICKKHSSPI